MLKVGELAKAHFHDSICLDIVKPEAITKSLLSDDRSFAALNDVDYLVDVVGCNNQALHNVCTCLGFAKLELCAANDYIVAVKQEVGDNLLEIKCLRTSVHKCYIVHAERRLHLRHLEELVEHNIGVGITLYVDDDAHTLTVALVVDIRDAFDLLLFHELCDALDEDTLVYVVGNLRYDDFLTIILCFNFGLGTHYYASLPGFKRLAHAIVSIYDTACGEVGRFDVFHQLRDLHIGILEEREAGVD